MLQTERLLIRPLSYRQLLLYVRPGPALEHDLGVKPHPRTLPDELREALEQVILPGVAQSGGHYLFSTLWTIIERTGHVMVGDLCFKGPPNEQGEIEVGYGTYPDFQNKGYMTQALGAVIQWAMHQPGVKAVLAETEKDNLPSHKTLLKNGFAAYQEVDQMIWWRLVKPLIA